MNTGKLKRNEQEKPDKRKILSALICARLLFQKASSKSRLFLFSIFAGLICAGCRGSQSALDAGGIQSERLENLWWIFFYICATVYLIVMAILLTALFRTKKADAQTAAEIAPNPEREKRISNSVKVAVAVSLIALFALMITSFRTGRAINTLAQSPDALSIKIKGHQWWWEVEYEDPTPSNNVTTANEIHIPVGRPIKLELESNDVIHSFWLPNLHGKKDLVPNYPTTFYFQADKAGTYSGQCAEYCGYQHAKMRFIVVAEAPEDFDKWINAQRQSSAVPATDLQKRGQEIFLTSVCTQCHTIQGTIAGGKVGPNLTHIASQQYIAAGSLQNTREHLENWVTDPQKIKPGIRMPMNNYSKEDLEALIEYLENLK
ncbi:MAG TPA: cytochrome c oxidase subunit II [Pyrinomonadaceae bacterium]|jgi:cytochrome c oxidase subunit 2